MYFEYRFAARLLMEAVNILGNNGFKLSLFLKLRKLYVRDVGFYTVEEDFFSVEPVKLLRVMHEK